MTLIIITIGASIFLRGLAQLVLDKNLHRLPPLFGGEPIAHRRRHHPAAEPGGAGGAAVIVVLLWLFIDRTLLGKAVLATAANRLAAQLVGINVRRIVGFSFAVSAAIGAVAGILIAPITFTTYDVGRCSA